MAGGARCLHLLLTGPPPLSFFVMTKPLAKCLAVCGACAAISIGVVAIRWHLKEPVPAFGGKPLGYWFHELPPTMVVKSNTVATAERITCLGLFGGTYGSQQVQPSTSIAAIQEMGTSAIPFMLDRLSRHNFPFSRQLDRGAFACGLKSTWFVNRAVERAQAVTGLLALPSLPQSAIDHLNGLRRSSDPAIAASAGFIADAQRDKTAEQFIDRLHEKQ
jgi:hypothetical protein